MLNLSSHPNSANRNKSIIVIGVAAAVALATFLLYLPALQNQFVEWDDNEYVFENTHIRFMDAVLLKWAFSSFHAGNWHPLTWISHSLDYAFWGLNPLGHHLTNNILHAFNSFLVVLVVLRLLEVVDDSRLKSYTSRFKMIAAGTTGLLFGIHPIHVESVAWVAERKDLLCALFYLLSVMAYIHHRSHKSHKTYFLCLILFALALLSKPMAVSLPVVLIILDWYPFQSITSIRTFLKCAIEKAPFFAFAIVSSVLTILAQKAGGAMGFMDVVSLSTRSIVAVHSLIAYLGHMIMPVGLVFFYPYPKSVSLFSLEYFLPLALVIVITALSLRVFRRRIWFAVWTYYIITLVPVIGLVQVGSQSLADRYTYLPSIGPFLLAGLAATKVVEYAGRRGIVFIRIAAVTGVAIAAVLSVMTVKQIGIWRDSITLWTSVIERIPSEAFFAYHNRGLAYSRLGEYDKAIEDYRRAIELKPAYADTYSNLGIALLNKGLREDAIRNYRIAISLNPELANAHHNLAVVLYMSGDVSEALEHYRIVAVLRPDDAGAHADLGSAFGAMGEYDKAIEQFQLALRLRPNFADAHYNLATAYRMMGRIDDANKHYEAARRLSP